MRWLSVLLVAACKPAPFERVPGSVPVSAETPAIVCLGDSLTAGEGVPAEAAWPALIARKVKEAGLPFSVVNAGVSGDTSAGGLRRLAAILRRPVAVVVVEFGINDAWQGVPVANTRANLAAIVEQSRAAGKRVVLVGTKLAAPTVPERWAEFDAMIASLAAEARVPLVPFLLEGVTGVAALNQPDGLHPIAAGYVIIAGTVWPVLEPVLRATAKR